MRIGVDGDACIGAGQCVLAAPDLFDQDEDDGLVRLLEPAPTGAQESGARAAAAACPASVITLRD
ncbi:ferredoxin [Blastococcus sp. URHD0036]|uniref:ferredoxin n=1 Tax=Blastococcus sp. URHD0036 TaxID=1380356 RepID=UPI00049682FB|nr:ferredoxin [Blastococcus sp. URHD0036]